MALCTWVQSTWSRPVSRYIHVSKEVVGGGGTYLVGVARLTIPPSGMGGICLHRAARLRAEQRRVLEHIPRRASVPGVSTP